MRIVTFTIVVVVGACIGALLSAMLHDNPRPLPAPGFSMDEPEIVTSEASEPVPRPAPDQTQDPAPSAVVPAVAEDGAATPAPVAASDGLSAALAEVAVREYEQGEGFITGVVIDGDGDPMSDVEVTAVIWGVTPGPEPATIYDATLEQYVLQEIDQYHYDLAMISRATTGADGRFDISGIRADSTYHLHGRKENWFFHGKGIDRIKAGTDCEIQGVPTASVHVQVDGPAELVARGGVIYPAVEDQNGRLVGWVKGVRWRPESPTVELPLLPIAQFRGAALSDVVSVSLAQGEAGSLRFTLKALPTVRGSVQFADGDPMSRGSLSVRLRAVGTTSRPEGGGGRSMSAVNLATGTRSFAVPNVAPGAYEAVLKIGYEEVTRVPFQVDRDDVFVDVPVPPLDRRRHLLLRVTDIGGTPIQGVHVRTRLAWNGGNDSYRNSESEAAYDSDGTYWIQLYEKDDQPGANLSGAEASIQLKTPRHGVQTIEVTDFAQVTEVVFDAPAYANVTLRGFDDRRFRDQGALRVAGQSESEQQPLTGHDMVRLGPIAPGEAEIVLVHMTDYDWRDVGSVWVTLAPGDNDVVFDFPALYELRVAIPEGLRGGRLSMQPQFGENADSWSTRHVWREIHGAPAVVIGWNPAGRYELSLYGDGENHKMEVDLIGDQSVVFEAMVSDAVLVEGVEAGGRMQEWGFRAGDLICSVDGVEVESYRQARLVLVRLLAKGTSTVRLLRSGAIVELQFSKEQAVDYTTLGAELEPASRR